MCRDAMVEIPRLSRSQSTAAMGVTKHNSRGAHSLIATRPLRETIFLALVLVLLQEFAMAEANLTKNESLALTPPMGWSTW